MSKDRPVQSRKKWGGALIVLGPFSVPKTVTVEKKERVRGTSFRSLRG